MRSGSEFLELFPMECCRHARLAVHVEGWAPSEDRFQMLLALQPTEVCIADFVVARAVY